MDMRLFYILGDILRDIHFCPHERGKMMINLHDLGILGPLMTPKIFQTSAIQIFPTKKTLCFAFGSWITEETSFPPPCFFGPG